MTLADFFGYVAAALLLGTFSVRTMIPLRILGISSSVAFLIYAYLGSLTPIIILHVILLPLNLYRFVEIFRQTRDAEGATNSAEGLAVLLPFADSVVSPAGETLFRKGDNADNMYVVSSGRVRLPELDTEIGPGEMVGEVGMFSLDGRRMTTAICTEDCKLRRIGRERVRELVFQNPRIGFHLIGIVTDRLLEDLKGLEKRLSENAGGAR